MVLILAWDIHVAGIILCRSYAIKSKPFLTSGKNIFVKKYLLNVSPLALVLGDSSSASGEPWGARDLHLRVGWIASKHHHLHHSIRHHFYTDQPCRYTVARQSQCRVVETGCACAFSSLRTLARQIFFTDKVCLTNPGVSQSNTEANGKLGIIQTVGNLRRIRLNAAHQSGPWKISMKSDQPYTVKVTGQMLYICYLHMAVLYKRHCCCNCNCLAHSVSHQ